MYYQVIARTANRGTLLTETSNHEGAVCMEYNYRLRPEVVWTTINCVNNSEFERGRREGRI